MKFGQWLGLGALAATAVVLWSLRHALLTLFAATVVAIALCTLVSWVRQRLNCGRPLALALSLGLILLAALLVATVVIPPFVEEFSQLVVKLPDAAATLVQLLRTGLVQASHMVYGQEDTNLGWLNDTLQPKNLASADWLGSFMGLLGLASGFGRAVLQGLFVAAVGLMVAIQPAPYREVFVLMAPSFYRRRLRQVLVLCGDALSAWMVGVLISSLCVGTLAAIGLSLLGVKLVAANALLAGLLNIIPNLGPTLSTIFPMAVALLEAPWKALAVLILYVAVQNLESYLITPSVMHHQLRLLPGLTLAAQLLFATIFGPLGLLLALPMAVCIQVILREVVIHDIFDPWKKLRSP